MIGTGTGSEIRQPLGFAIVGGLIVSQALTLYTTPVVSLYLDRLGSWLRLPPIGGLPGRGGFRRCRVGGASSLAWPIALIGLGLTQAGRFALA